MDRSWWNRKRSLGLTMTAVCVLATLGGGVQAEGDDDETSPNAAPAGLRWVVGFETMNDVRAGDSWHGAQVFRTNERLGFAVMFDERAGFDAFAAQQDGVRWAERDVLVHALYTPNDERWSSQYGARQINAPGAWDQTLGETNKELCIVDSGVRSSHEDITGARWLGGYDYVANDNIPNDASGHGTHVQGIAGATTDNGHGIAGIAQVGVYHVRVLNAAGQGYASDVADGIDWCRVHGGDVINLSLGTSSDVTVIRTAVSQAWNAGLVIVAAAGNDGPCSNCVLYPAKYSQAIAVACTTSSEAQCGFSAEGSQVELAAPGHTILSTCYNSNTAYCNKSGTSMSSPHVAGAAALLWSYAPELTNDEVRQKLQETAREKGASGRDVVYGYGIVDVDAAIADLEPPPPAAAVFFEDFENATAANWTLSGRWHLSTRCNPPGDDNRYLGFHHTFACIYSWFPSSQGSATFPVDLRGSDRAALSFQHRWQTESTSGSLARDFMYVEGRTGNDAWQVIERWDSRDPNQLQWTDATLDLAPFAGQLTELRFRFDSANFVANEHAGWHIDNVRVLVE